MLRIITFILLLLHTNVSLLMPSVDEDDVYDANGQQVDDINSFTEYFYQVVLGNKDDAPEDEDDDKAQYYSLSSPILVRAIITSVYTVPQPRPVYITPVTVKWYGKYTESVYDLVTGEIPVPPPEA